MKSLFWGAAGVVAMGLITAGCGETSEQQVSAATPAVELESLTTADWPRVLAGQKGKVVVVDTWATWCVGCVQEFPELVKLHKAYHPRGVACISVTVDSPTAREQALEFLEHQQATFDNYIMTDGEDAWWDEWNIKSIPVVLVFDREGKLVKKFDNDDPDNQFTYADVEKLVAELVE